MAWRRQKDWSETANRLKDKFFLWNKVVYILAAIAAIAGTISTYFEAGSNPYVFASSIAAISAVISPIIAKMRLDPIQNKRWIRARSASEAYKSEIFLYRTKIGAYGNPDRSDKLNEAITLIDETVKDIQRFNTQSVSISEDMLVDLSISDYFESRVEKQIEKYYRPRAIHHGRLSQRYRSYHLILMLIGATLGAIAAITQLGVGPWIAVVTTITSSILAYGAAGRHDYLALSYTATANRLEELMSTWQDTPDKDKMSPEHSSALVSRCEEAISVENKSWYAKLSSPVTDLAAGANT